SVLVGSGTKEAPAARRRRRAAATAEAAVPASSPAPAADTAARAAAGTAPASRAPSSSPVAPIPARTAPVGAPAPAQGNGAPRPAAASAVLAKPPVRKLAKDLGVDLSAVAATGPGGIITREDVLAHAQRSEAEQLATYPGDDKPWLADGVVTANGRQTRVPVRSVRRRTAEAMVNSAFTAPHVTVFHTVDVTRSMKLVARLKGDRAFADVRVTPLLLAAKALVL